MKRILTLSLFFFVISYAMDQKTIGTIQLARRFGIDLKSAIVDGQKEPEERMALVQNKLSSYLQKECKKGNGEPSFQFAAMLNDAACDIVSKEYPAADLTVYRSNGQEYEAMLNLLKK